jgi:hypothetical protein
MSSEQHNEDVCNGEHGCGTNGCNADQTAPDTTSTGSTTDDVLRMDRRGGDRRAGDRRNVVDRRSGADRRAIESSEYTNLERRRGPGRRLSEFVRNAEEGEMSKEQFMFLMAIDAFKRANGKGFPSWSDVLEVVRKLGYRKTMASELNLGGRVEDWRERADAPSKTTHSDVTDTEHRRAA